MVKEISARNGAEMDILQTMCVKEVWGAELQEKEAMLIREKDRALMDAVGEREKVMVMGKMRGTGRMVVKDSKTGETVEVAGGKLYQVVVDSEKTGELLLKKGRLQRRVTIIPLNRIKHRTLPQAKVAQAQRVAPRGQVQLALMLVGYEKSVLEAIEYAGVRVAGGGAEGDVQPGDPRAHGDSGGRRVRAVGYRGGRFASSWCAGVVAVVEGEQGAWGVGCEFERVE